MTWSFPVFQITVSPKIKVKLQDFVDWHILMIQLQWSFTEVCSRVNLIYIPKIHGRGSSLYLHPLWRKALLCHWIRCSFHTTINSTSFLDVELFLQAAVFHSPKTIGGVFFGFSSDSASVEGLLSSISRFFCLILNFRSGCRHDHHQNCLPLLTIFF